jgi:hypothetical protein
MHKFFLAGLPLLAAFFGKCQKNGDALFRKSDGQMTCLLLQ